MPESGDTHPAAFRPASQVQRLEGALALGSGLSFLTDQ